MAIGERIKYFRKLHKMTQKELGTKVGFDEKSADIRMAQYETGTRTPKADLTRTLADTLEVSTRALNVPDIDNGLGVIHTLFAMEDIYGIEVDKAEDRLVLRVDESADLTEYISAWYEMKEKLNAGEISREEYDSWRYNYPVGRKKGEDGKPAGRTVDQILAELRANLDMLKSGQN